MVPCRNPVSLDALHRRRTGIVLLLRWCVPVLLKPVGWPHVVATSICVRCPHPCLLLIKATTVCHTLTSVSLSRRPSLISRLSLPRRARFFSAHLRNFGVHRDPTRESKKWQLVFAQKYANKRGCEQCKGAREREADRQTEKSTVWTQEKLIYPYLSLVGCIGSCSPEETHSRRPASSKSSCPKLPEGDAGSVGVRASRTSSVA